MTEVQEKILTILIVDDNPENVSLLEALLSAEYTIRTAARGSEALKIARKTPPDLILLDIMMPEMNGYEVCERLKDDPRLMDIPVIFLSGLESTEVKVKAFRSGGVDYITKPFQFEEVRARVKTHLMIRKLQLRLEAQNQVLEQTVAERTGELEIAYERLTTLDRIKGDFLMMISHEMRTPLNGILGISDMVFDLCPQSSQKDEYRQDYLQSQQRMEQLLEHSLLLNTIESSSRNVWSVSICLTDILAEAVRSIHDTVVAVDHAEELSCAMICCDLELLKRALVIFIKVAACFNAAGNHISLCAALKTDNVVIHIPLDFFKLSETQADDFFDITSTTRACSHAEELGLAPVVAERIIKLFGGSVCLIKSVENKGVISLTLPVSSMRDSEAED
jgi:DNA-binding response OmpR family regulator